VPFDVAVIGSGVIGRSCAWQIAETGRTVCIIDPYPGSGASYAAAGMLAPVTEASYGEESLTALGVQSAAMWPEFVEHLARRSALDPGYVASGTLLVAADASDRAALEDLYRFHATSGVTSELVAPSAARALEPLLAPSIRGGIFASSDAQVDNRRLLSALDDACVGLGVVERRTRAVAVAVEAGRTAGVETDSGRVAASAVVLAAGYQSVAFTDPASQFVPPTRPVKGQILRLRGPERGPTLTRTVRAIVGGSSVYVVPRRGNRIVLGATQEEVGVDERVTVGGVHALLRDALRVLPSLGEYEITEARAGLRPGSPDNAPIVGPTGLPGVWVATGHHRNGILLAPYTAKMICALLSGSEFPEEAVAVHPGRFTAA
jgi:glycine oxidase